MPERAPVLFRFTLSTILFRDLSSEVLSPIALSLSLVTASSLTCRPLWRLARSSSKAFIALVFWKLIESVSKLSWLTRAALTVD